MINVWAVITVGGYSVFCSVGLGCDYCSGYSVVAFFCSVGFGCDYCSFFVFLLCRIGL